MIKGRKVLSTFRRLEYRPSSTPRTGRFWLGSWRKARSRRPTVWCDGPTNETPRRRGVQKNFAARVAEVRAGLAPGHPSRGVVSGRDARRAEEQADLPLG